MNMILMGMGQTYSFHISLKLPHLPCNSSQVPSGIDEHSLTAGTVDNDIGVIDIRKRYSAQRMNFITQRAPLLSLP
jgi:hypothetical protein